MAAIAPPPPDFGSDPFTAQSKLSQTLSTPTKSGITINSTELAEGSTPQATPAPGYFELPDAHLTSFPRDATKYIEKLAHLHPTYPTGNVTHDLRDHLPCHQNFNSNVEVIIYRYNQLKKDYDQTLLDLGKAQRDLRREVEEKEAWQSRCQDLEAALRDEQEDHRKTKEDLARARVELIDITNRLNSAISQLAEAVRKLEETRKALRDMTRERDNLRLEVSDLNRMLAHYKSRITDLQKALDVANEGENCANDRNARLTVMLFQIESQKAEIERLKDRAQAEVRNLTDELNSVTSRGLVGQLREQIKVLDRQIVVLKAELAEAEKDPEGRKKYIEKLQAKIEELSRDITKANQDAKDWKEKADKSLLEVDVIRKIKNNFRDRFDLYASRVQYLDKICKPKFGDIKRPADEGESRANTASVETFEFDNTPAVHEEEELDIKAQSSEAQNTKDDDASPEIETKLAPEETIVTKDDTPDSNTDADASTEPQTETKADMVGAAN